MGVQIWPIHHALENMLCLALSLLRRELDGNPNISKLAAQCTPNIQDFMNILTEIDVHSVSSEMQTPEPPKKPECQQPSR